jgi:hypothetical protein
VIVWATRAIEGICGHFLQASVVSDCVCVVAFFFLLTTVTRMIRLTTCLVVCSAHSTFTLHFISIDLLLVFISPTPFTIKTNSHTDDSFDKVSRCLQRAFAECARLEAAGVSLSFVLARTL